MLKPNNLEQLPDYRIVPPKLIIRLERPSLQLKFIVNDNIGAQHLEQKRLYLNPKGKGRLALNILKQVRKFWRSIEFLNESFLPFDLPNKTDHKVLGKSKNFLSEQTNEENTYEIRGLTTSVSTCENKPHIRIKGHIDINSIRNKFESLAKYVGNNLDIPRVANFNWGFFNNLLT